MYIRIIYLPVFTNIEKLTIVNVFQNLDGALRIYLSILKNNHILK